MAPKDVLMILLFLSGILVLYPYADALNKAQEAINNLNKNNFDMYDNSLDGPRNELLMQIVGLILLYTVLGLALTFIDTTLHKLRQAPKLSSAEAVVPPAAVRIQKNTQQLYEELSNSYIRIFGSQNGQRRLEKRIEDYLNRGYNRESAIQKLAEEGASP